MKLQLLPLAALPLLPLAAMPLRAAEPAIGFNRDVRPILSNNCFKCHGPDLKKGGLDLQSRDSALKPLKSEGFAIAPGNPMTAACSKKSRPSRRPCACRPRAMH